MLYTDYISILSSFGSLKQRRGGGGGSRWEGPDIQPVIGCVKAPSNRKTRNRQPEAFMYLQKAGLNNKNKYAMLLTTFEKV